MSDSKNPPGPLARYPLFDDMVRSLGSVALPNNQPLFSKQPQQPAQPLSNMMQPGQIPVTQPGRKTIHPYRSKPMNYNIPKPTGPVTDGVIDDAAGAPGGAGDSSFAFDEDPVQVNMVIDPRTKQPVTCPVCERVVAEFCFDGDRVALGCTGGCFVTSIGEPHQCWVALREWTDGRVAAGAVAATRTADELDADAEQLAARMEAAASKLRLVKGGG